MNPASQGKGTGFLANILIQKIDDSPYPHHHHHYHLQMVYIGRYADNAPDMLLPHQLLLVPEQILRVILCMVKEGLPALCELSTRKKMVEKSNKLSGAQ